MLGEGKYLKKAYTCLGQVRRGTKKLNLRSRNVSVNPIFRYSMEIDPNIPIFAKRMREKNYFSEKAAK